MILYQLRCALGHDFEGWFRDSGAFEQQAERGLLSCPTCGSTKVDRGLMAPAVRTTKAARPVRSVPEPGSKPGPGQNSGSGQLTAMPDALRAELQRIRAVIERDCENMGDRFADEAIRMHQGEAEERGIYGSTTERDRDALADAGVEVMAIPWLKPADG